MKNDATSYSNALQEVPSTAFAETGTGLVLFFASVRIFKVTSGRYFQLTIFYYKTLKKIIVQVFFHLTQNRIALLHIKMAQTVNSRAYCAPQSLQTES